MNRGAGYTNVGTGYCVDAAKADKGGKIWPMYLADAPPFLSKKCVSLDALSKLCDTFDACIAIELGNNPYHSLRFSSAKALDAITAPAGWDKNKKDHCQENCRVTKGDGAKKGQCWAKTTGKPKTTRNRDTFSLSSSHHTH